MVLVVHWALEGKSLGGLEVEERVRLTLEVVDRRWWERVDLLVGVVELLAGLILLEL